MIEQRQEAEVSFLNGFVDMRPVWKDGEQWFADRMSEPLPVLVEFVETVDDVKCFDEVRN